MQHYRLKKIKYLTDPKLLNGSLDLYAFSVGTVKCTFTQFCVQILVPGVRPAGFSLQCT